jgi:hypothetical protein
MPLKLEILLRADWFVMIGPCISLQFTMSTPGRLVAVVSRGVRPQSSTLETRSYGSITMPFQTMGLSHQESLVIVAFVDGRIDVSRGSPARSLRHHRAVQPDVTARILHV